MAGIPFVDVDYCQFSHWGYQKPTRVWGDLTIAKIQPKLCDGETCENLEMRGNGRKGHQKILGGNHMTTTRKEKYRVPEALVCYLCGWSDPEVFETAVQCIHVLQLHATKEVRFEKSSNQLNLRCLAHQLDKYGALEHYIQSVVCAQEAYEGEDVDALRNQILEDYKDSVFADKHEHEPPIRGPFGEATIELKPGVTPV